MSSREATVSAPSFDYSGKVVLVTGGTKGVGRGIALGFLQAGANVAVCARNPAGAPIAYDGREAAFVAANVRKPDEVAALVSNVVSRFGRLDVLVNNAGGAPPADAATASPRFAASIIDLNLTAALTCAQAANGVMQRQGGGSIVNVASVSGVRASPGTAAYGAAKAGLLSLTSSLAVEWAPHVRVNAIVAGMIRTEQSALHYGDEDGVAAAAASVPLGRLGEPSDVANLCLFLSSPLASYVSGAHVLLHGGGERPAFLSAVRTAHD